MYVRLYVLFFFYKTRWFAPIYLKYGFIWKCCSPYKPLNLFSFQIFWRLNFLLTLRIRIHSDSTNYFFICSTFYLFISIIRCVYPLFAIYLYLSKLPFIYLNCFLSLYTYILLYIDLIVLLTNYLNFRITVLSGFTNKGNLYFSLIHIKTFKFWFF